MTIEMTIEIPTQALWAWLVFAYSALAIWTLACWWIARDR